VPAEVNAIRHRRWVNGTDLNFLRRSNFAQNLKHTTSPKITMSTMLSALRIIIYFGRLACPKQIPK
jgi:hypothetical protein